MIFKNYRNIVVQKWVLIITLAFVSSLCHASKWVKVEYVIDGDTIVITGGQKIRLLSINAPEIAHNGKGLEAGGNAAKNWLKQKILGQQVYLEKNIQHHDKYGRTLAFIKNKQGENINLLLVENGLATLSIHPPNTKHVAALQWAQRDAKQHTRGLWSRPEYRLRSVQQIPQKRLMGWGRFKAKVSSIQKTKKGYKLWLQPNVYLWVGNKSLPWVKQIESYKHKTIEVRGWPRRRGNNWSINIRHASQIIL